MGSMSNELALRLLSETLGLELNLRKVLHIQTPFEGNAGDEFIIVDDAGV